MATAKVTTEMATTLAAGKMVTTMPVDAIFFDLGMLERLGFASVFCKETTPEVMQQSRRSIHLRLTRDVVALRLDRRTRSHD